MQNKLKSKILKAIKSKKLHVFGLFFVLAFLFSIFTKLSKTYTDTVTLHFTYTNVPQDKTIALDSSQDVKVMVKTYGFNLLPYYLYKHDISVDFKSDVSLKDKNYVWTSKQGIQKISKEIGNSVEIISIKPDTLLFPFHTLAVKKVPVKVNHKIKFVAGYDYVDAIHVQPDSVKLIGSETLLSKISSVNTEPLVLNEVNSDFSKTVAIAVTPTLKKMKLSQYKVAVSAKVQKFTEGTFEIPVTIVNLPVGTTINYFPKTIPVIYYVSLNDYKLIKPADFVLECDFNDIKNTDKTFFTPKLVDQPKQVKSVRLKQNKVEFILIQ